MVLQSGTPKTAIGAVPGTGQLYGTNVRVVCSESWKRMPQLWMCLRKINLAICEHGGYRIPSNCTVLKGNILINISYMNILMNISYSKPM